MKSRFIASIIFCALAASATMAQEHEGEYLYKVSTIRAAPGTLPDLLNWIDALRKSGFFEDAGESSPFIMRHSQGDQWDLMIITPMENWADYYSDSSVQKRLQAFDAHSELLADADGLIAFDEDIFAYGPTLPVLQNAFETNNFLHIEMFEAIAGKTDELIDQRRMENKYLSATGQTPNMIFVRTAGSDVDVLTIGFHESLEVFAAPAPVSDEEKELAAKAAGFKDRADISFYLRSLISGHHDTLANKVD